jgi:hypothetical protein
MRIGGKKPNTDTKAGRRMLVRLYRMGFPPIGFR